jgi:hypothetical protein
MEEGPGVCACCAEGRGCLCPWFGVRAAGGWSVFQDYVPAGAAYHRRGLFENQKDSVKRADAVSPPFFSLTPPSPKVSDLETIEDLQEKGLMTDIVFERL